jgi:xanthine/uracil/vitamin C permease (AzgA family)
MECYCGVVQFISCLYVLPVVPYQMKRVGYDETASIVATTVTCAIGSIVASFVTDMPLIIAPPTSVSIFLAVSMQQEGLGKDAGCAAVVLSGAALAFVGACPPLARFISKVCARCPDSAIISFSHISMISITHRARLIRHLNA